MTKLVVDELFTTLSQTFTVTNQIRLTIKAIRPYIYMHNNPSGTFTISLKEGATTLASKTFDSASIKTDLSTSDNYAHIFKTIVFDDPVYIGDGEYEIELSSSGYSYSKSSYIGWVREHENLINEVNGTPISDFGNPRTFQLLTKQAS